MRTCFRSPAATEEPVFLPILRRPVLIHINLFLMLHSGLRLFAQFLSAEDLDLDFVSLSVEFLDDCHTLYHHRSRVAGGRHCIVKKKMMIKKNNGFSIFHLGRVSSVSLRLSCDLAIPRLSSRG